MLQNLNRKGVLQVSCLLNHYKDFAKCPRHIDAKVIEVEEMTQTAPLRRKLQVRSSLL
jgi:hypothetical protein